MKTHKILLLTTLLLANAASANVMIRSQSHGATDVCTNLPGIWSGAGVVRAGFVTCHYAGVANVTETGPGALMLDIKLQKKDGLCPDQEQIQLPGTCSAGVLSLKTDYADLHGDLNETGTEANLAGTVTINVMGSPVIAHVDDMHLVKQ